METIQVELISLNDIRQLTWVNRAPPEWRSGIIADSTWETVFTVGFFNEALNSSSYKALNVGWWEDVEGNILGLIWHVHEEAKENRAEVYLEQER
jgi:hypothetical protein